MKLGKRTAKLVREAAVAAFVDGVHCGQHAPRDPAGFPIIPKDSEILRRCYALARSMPDLYPTLATVDEKGREDNGGTDERP